MLGKRYCDDIPHLSYAVGSDDLIFRTAETKEDPQDVLFLLRQSIALEEVELSNDHFESFCDVTYLPSVAANLFKRFLLTAAFAEEPRFTLNRLKDQFGKIG